MGLRNNFKHHVYQSSCGTILPCPSVQGRWLGRNDTKIVKNQRKISDWSNKRSDLMENNRRHWTTYASPLWEKRRPCLFLCQSSTEVICPLHRMINASDVKSVSDRPCLISTAASLCLLWGAALQKEKTNLRYRGDAETNKGAIYRSGFHTHPLHTHT